MGGILGGDRPAHSAAHRWLLTSVGAQLAAQHGYGIPLLLQGPVIPALDRGEAEANGLARRRVLPGALCQCGNGGGELALARWCGQHVSTHGKAMRDPPSWNSVTSR